MQVYSLMAPHNDCARPMIDVLNLMWHCSPTFNLFEKKLLRCSRLEPWLLLTPCSVADTEGSLLVRCSGPSSGLWPVKLQGRFFKQNWNRFFLVFPHLPGEGC